MGRERDEDTGKFEEEFSNEDFIQVLSSHGGGVGTQTVADEVGCAYRTAHDRLKSLENEGVVTSRRVANALLWEIDVNHTEDDG
jgi:predicted ArsR family transcriptional regulator